jgi:hypothetical protein
MINIYSPNNHDGDKTTGLSAAKAKTNFAKYEDPTKEFSSDELRLGFWYVRHKALLYKIAVIILVVINAGIIIFNLWHWGVYIVGISDQQKLETSLAAAVNYTGIHPHVAAQPVQVINTQVFPSGKNKYDLVSELVNPNSRFLVQFNYYFVVNGVKTETQKTFLLPGESRFVVNAGLENNSGGSPEIVLGQIIYKRISNHQIANLAGYQAYRLNFQVSDFIFSKSLAQEGDNADAVQFKLTNASPYNYVDSNFYVALLQGGQMVGILPLHVDSINSLETKNIDIRSFVPNLNVTEIALYPIINIYDNSAYAP